MMNEIHFEEIIFRQLERVRKKTINMVEHIAEEQANKVPLGFNNSILWHLGHIYIYGERFGFQLTGHESQFDLPPYYEKLFSNGTKPSEWEITPPLIEMLLSQLKEQVVRTQKALSGKLSEKIDKTIMQVENPSIAEILLCWMIHEKEHAGFISAIKKLVIK